MSLLERLADPAEFAFMTMSEKLVGTLYVSILGIGITFLVLLFLQYAIVLMSLLVNGPRKKAPVAVTESNVSLEKPLPALEQEALQDDDELIAVITAAVAACLGRPVDSFVVRNVQRAADGSPNWAKAGLVEQMNIRKS